MWVTVRTGGWAGTGTDVAALTPTSLGMGTLADAGVAKATRPTARLARRRGAAPLDKEVLDGYSATRVQRSCSRSVDVAAASGTTRRLW